VDGALSVAGVGTSDLTFAAAGLTLIRAGLDDELERIVTDQGAQVTWKAGKDPMTGMLIRSELVRRWPELVVRAKKKDGLLLRSMGILRREPISRDVLIALFAGQPTQVEVREPDVAMRFGVEGQTSPKVNLRHYNGEFATGQFIDIGWRNVPRRVLDVAGLAKKIEAHESWNEGPVANRKPGARDVAINLEQLPYVQIFTTTEPEQEGSKSGRGLVLVQGKPAIPLRKGRFLFAEAIAARAGSIFTMEDTD
jgi:hypothetical protein